jgi:phenylalanyl-tRNA synthetase beta chain
MKILTPWLRSYLPTLAVDDTRLAEDLTLRGIAVEGIFGLNEGEGSLFDMDITTNRVDAMNHYGIAREAAAIYNVPLHPLDTKLPEAQSATAPYPVRIEAPELCGRFTAQVIRNVTIAPSKGLTNEYFAHLGQKSISDAVDATNFVMLGMGHPTHAFDLDKVQGGIVVRHARAGEQLQLLDGTTRTLVAEDLVVADEVKALGLAGVMGGFESMITSDTKNILVEAAWFDPAAIRASSRRHLIHTDASHRFERGADFAAAPVANALVTRHILDACGGTLEGALVDVVVPQHAARTIGRPPVQLSVSQVKRHLGVTLAPEGISAELVQQYLSALGCTLTANGPGTYAVALPSWRLDLTREIDLIEEIARVYGYNRFANTLPQPGIVVAHPQARAEQDVRQRLFALGYSEAISSTFASAADCAAYAPSASAVALENPLSEEAADLRPTLLPGMVGMLANNLNRDVTSVRLFEAGAIFSGSTTQVDEALSLSLGLTGKVAATPLYGEEDAPFFELKGVVQSLLDLFVADPIFIRPQHPGTFEPGRACSIELFGRHLGSFGQLSASEAARRKLRQPIYLAELNLASVFALPLRQATAHELSRFQAVERDFSFTFAESTEWQKIADAIAALALPALQRISAEEIFRDPTRLPGKFSILIRTVFQAQDHTLTEDELSTWSTAIVHALQALGGSLRSA